MAWRMKEIEWTPGQSGDIVLALPEDIQEYILNEIQLSKIDFLYWLRRYAHIVDDKGRNVPIDPWPSQKAVLDVVAEVEKEAWDRFQRVGPDSPAYRELMAKIAIIILKSRQIGGTAIAEALLAHQVIFFHHTRAVIASDHIDNSLKLFRVFLNIIDSLHGWMRPVENARVKNNNIHFSELDSDVITGAGNQKSTLGQGMTVDCVHLTEVSTWGTENAWAIDADLKPAFSSSRKHHSLFLIESTGAGGKGNWFHDQFEGALSGQSMFKPIFIGWFMCPSKWTIDPEGVTIGEEVKGVLKNILAESGVDCTRGQAAWYQKMRNEYGASGKLDLFIQEFPSSAEEAFSFGAKSAWPIEIRSKVRAGCKLPQSVFKYNSSALRFEKTDPLEFMRDESKHKTDGALMIWEKALPGYTYVVGVDSSYGIEGGDSSAIEVLRVGNKWFPDEQVAEWHGTLSPADLSVPCWLIGHMYTDKAEGLPALMAIESNPGSPGIVAQTDLMRRGYQNFYVYRRPLKAAGGGWTSDVGWWTTSATRPSLTEDGVSDIAKGNLLINSPYFVREMDSFGPQYNKAGQRKLEHSPGMHDDRIMALFIARYVAHEADTRSIADERRKSHEQRNRPPEKVVQFAEMGISWEQALELFEEKVASYD